MDIAVIKLIIHVQLVKFYGAMRKFGGTLIESAYCVTGLADTSQSIERLTSQCFANRYTV